MKALVPLILVVTALGLSACATKDPASLAQNDPWEPTNRAIFDLDIQLDHAVARPIAEAYVAVFPDLARAGIHNALTNLNAPVVFVNDALQLDGDKAGDTAGRFLVNSTAGLGGFIDVASKLGIPYHDNDFGITLGKGGAGEGSYLVLPVAGPKPPRDLVGAGVDIIFDPLTYITFHGSDTWAIVRTGVGVLDTRASNLDAVESVERSSIDFYATTRSLYRQDRAAAIKDDATNSDLPNF